MLTLVSSYNTLENNLERHEIRERALGEVIKKGLQTLHKGQRIFEPMRGTFSRLDERISQMETLLMARDTELKDQQADTRSALRQTLDWQAARDAREAADRQKSDERFEQLLQAVNAVAAAAAATPPPAPATTPKPASDNSDDDDDVEDVGKKVDDLAESVKRLRQEVAEMMADRSHADDAIKALIGQAERLVGAQVASSEDVVAKLDEKLTSFYVTASATSTTTAAPVVTTAASQPRSTDWENSVQTALATIETGLRSLQADATKKQQPLFDREFIAGLANETLAAITDMRIEVLTASDKSFAKTAMRIKEATSTLDEAIAEAVRTIGEQAGQTVTPAAVTPVSTAAAAVEQLNEAVLHSYTELRADLAGLRQLEKLALETGDNVLAVKRGMEYNVHAITAEIGELIRGQGATIDASLIEHFEQMNGTIQANHNGALANLTAKIETEISQVWRQIGIMFHMVQSTETSLNKLQEQTEIYVNGTSAVMDGMGGKVCGTRDGFPYSDITNFSSILAKVSQITERMAEVDSNLNYLLGRLSLVTQEFNQIKTGLGSALDDIKSSFQSVQKKIQGEHFAFRISDRTHIDW